MQEFIPLFQGLSIPEQMIQIDGARLGDDIVYESTTVFRTFGCQTLVLRRENDNRKSAHDIREPLQGRSPHKYLFALSGDVGYPNFLPAPGLRIEFSDNLIERRIASENHIVPGCQEAARKTQHVDGLKDIGFPCAIGSNQHIDTIVEANGGVLMSANASDM